MKRAAKIAARRMGGEPDDTIGQRTAKGSTPDPCADYRENQVKLQLYGESQAFRNAIIPVSVVQDYETAYSRSSHSRSQRAKVGTSNWSFSLIIKRRRSQRRLSLSVLRSACGAVLAGLLSCCANASKMACCFAGVSYHAFLK